jgi:hypothetical protein
MAQTSLQFRLALSTRRPRLWAAVVGLLVLPIAGWAADQETRDFRVLVDGKPRGEAHMTFNRQDDGTTTMSCDTDVQVQILLYKYTYSYRGREVWKNGQLQSFASKCTDDGKHFEVAAVVQDKNIRIRVTTEGKQEERLVSSDVWLTSYWSQPDAKVVNKTIAIIDADSGGDLSAKVSYIGPEQFNMGGQTQQVHHYRLDGKTVTDLWYDAAGRLFRQDWLEQNHRTVLELARIRR